MKKAAGFLFVASFFTEMFSGGRKRGYRAGVERLKMKGLSAEEMGTANRKKTRRERMRGRKK